MNPADIPAALDAARALAAAGVPVFAAPPRFTPTGEQDWRRSGGYQLPTGWENTPADPTTVDAWQPGWALCAVMGRKVDGIDIDAHKGGNDSLIVLAERNALPEPYGIAHTPSGGRHLLVARTGSRSRDNLLPGLDLKAGHEGQGHGFLFIAPTVKPSKVTGELTAYRWAQVPQLGNVRMSPQTTNLAALVAEVRSAKPSTPAQSSPPADPARVAAYCTRTLEAIRAELAAAAEWDEGTTDDRGRGWEKLVADAAWRVASVGVTPGSGVDEAEAEALFNDMVPPVMAETDIYTAAEKWRLQSRRAEPVVVPPDLLTAMGLNAPPPVTAEAITTGSVVGTITGPPVLPNLPDVFDPPTLGESGMALSAMAVVGPLHRYARDECGWYTRDDRKGHWVRQPAGALDWTRHIVHQLAQRAPRGNSAADDTTPEAKQAKRWSMLHNSARRGSIARLMLDSAPDAGMEAADMDADPRVLWAGGWCWDLAASRDVLTPAASVDLLTPHVHSAAVMPADIDTPRWDALVEALFPTEELRGYFYGVMGAATTGISGRILGVVYGATGMAKTSILELSSLVLGTYATQLDADLLDARKSDEFKVMALKGIRLGWVDEGPSNNQAGQERLKALTGGASMRGAHKGKPAVTFRPTHTLFFTDNREPDVSDPALLSRVRGLNVTGDPEVIARAVGAIRNNEDEWLAAEGPGVLAKFIRAAGRFLADRSTADMPAEVAEALLRLSREQDPILSWLDDRTEPVGETGSSDLYADFRTYAEAHGVPRSLIHNNTVWGRRLTEIGYPPRKTVGIKVRPLSLRRWSLGPGMVVPTSPAELSTTVPQHPSDSPKPSNGEGSASGAVQPDVGDSGQGTVDRPSSRGPSPDKTHSQTAVRDTRDTRDSSTREEEEVEVKEREASTRLGAPAPAHTRARDSKPEPADKSRAAKPVDLGPMMVLPALQVRGSELPTPAAMTDAAALLATLAGQTVTLDLETSGYPTGHDLYRPKMIQLGNEAWALVLDAADPDQVALAVSTLDAASEVVAHSATADVSLLAIHAGVDSAGWWAKTTDTAVLAALAPADLTDLHGKPGALKLKTLSDRLLADEAVAPAADKARAALFRKGKWLSQPKEDTPHERNGWAQVPIGAPAMITYGASDVLDTAVLRRKLPTPAPALLERERAVQAMCARLPERGVLLDPDKVRDEHARYTSEANSWAERLAASGVTEPGSNAQVAAALQALGAQLPVTPKGNVSTAADVVDKIAGTQGPAGDLARDLLAWREVTKLVSTYLSTALAQCEHGDGRAYPTILTMGAAATGRMSSTRPNIQNVPRPTAEQAAPGGGGGMRGMYLADPGHLWVDADFSSVEVRIAAAVTGDETLAHMVREGIDLHGEIVKLAWGIGPDHPDFKGIRYDAKRAVFGYLYGAGLTTMARQLGAHGDKAQDVVDALKAITPALIQFDRGLRRAVESRELVSWVHPSGRTAYFNPDQPHKSLNTIVQGYGRELLVDAMLRWEAMHPGATVIPIHDELVVHAPEAEADVWQADLVECMTTELDMGRGAVPIVSEGGTPTRRWGTQERVGGTLHGRGVGA